MATTDSNFRHARSRIALIGAGFIADYHAEAIRRFPELKLVAVCDPDVRQAQRVASRWSIPAVHASLDELLAAHEVDVAHVLVPPALHERVAESLLDAGVGAFIEKPMGLDADTCHRLAWKAEERGLRLAVNHNAVFDPAFVRLRRHVVAGRIGRIEHVVCTVELPVGRLEKDPGHWMFAEPANIIFERAPHPLSQLLVLLGDVRTLDARASGRRVLRNGRIFYDTWHVTLDCERGPASLTLVFGKEWQDAYLRVVGQDGVAHADLLAGTCTLDRRTRYREPIDAGLRGLGLACSVASQAARNVSGWALGTVRIADHQDPFYRSVRDSVAELYSASNGNVPFELSAHLGAEVVALCKRVALAATGDSAIEDGAGGTVCAVERRHTKANGPNVTTKAPLDAALHPPADVLVTGGFGFLGTHVIARLIADGRRVRTLVRRPSAMPASLRGLPIDVVAGDVCNEDDVRTAACGVRAVYHLAYGIADDWEAYERINTVAMQNVIEACFVNTVERLLFTSTIAVYPPLRADVVVTEATAIDRRPHRRNDYVNAKIKCEEMVREAGRRGLATVIARPGVVIGYGERLTPSSVGEWPVFRHCLGWGAGDCALPFVLVGDVADALAVMLDVPEIAGTSFNLVGDVDLSAREYVAVLSAALGRDIRFHRRPPWRIHALDLFKWIVKAAARRPSNWFPSVRDLRARCERPRFDCSRAKAALEWTPVADPNTFLRAAGLVTEYGPEELSIAAPPVAASSAHVSLAR